MMMKYPNVQQAQLKDRAAPLVRILPEHIEAAERSGPSG